MAGIGFRLNRLLKSDDIVLKTLFSQKIASYLLNKHWSSLAYEEKFKAFLLGEQDLHTIITETAKLVRQQNKKNLNPFYALYMKLLAEKGEEAANRDMKLMRKATSIKMYKKELYELMNILPINDLHFTDYQTITNSIKNWDKFSLPIIPNNKY